MKDIYTMREELRTVYRKRHPEWCPIPDWRLDFMIQNLGIQELHALAEANGEIITEGVK